jgi:hypothetical protein
MDQQHELVCKIKELAAELGRTPSRDQAQQVIFSLRRRLTAVGWTYQNLLDAAGLAPCSRERITNKIFEKDIDRHLENYEPQEIKPHEPWPKIAILGDLHEPFGSDKVKADFVNFVDKFKPDYVVQIGDLFDMYSHSKFPRSVNLFTPKDEEQAARKRVEELWQSVQKASSSSKCVGILGNHDQRPLKRTIETVPQFEHWIQKYFNELMTFDNVEMILDPKKEYIISDIAFIHGYLSKLGAHRDYMLMNTVDGHSHVGGVVFKQIHGKILWELNAGLAGDFNAKCFEYQNQRMSQWTNGFGYIDSYGPRFVPI